MFQNCLTMLHTMAPTNWMDTTLWVLCSAYLSGIMIRCLTFPFHLVIVYGRKIIQTGTGSIHNLARYAGISQQRSCHHPLWQLALHLRIPVGWDVLPNMENIFLLRTILCFPVKRSVIIMPASAGVLLRSSATGKSLPIAILLNNAFKKVQQGFTLWWAGLRCIIYEDCYNNDDDNQIQIQKVSDWKWH